MVQKNPQDLGLHALKVSVFTNQVERKDLQRKKSSRFEMCTFFFTKIGISRNRRSLARFYWCPAGLFCGCGKRYSCDPKSQDHFLFYNSPPGREDRPDLFFGLNNHDHDRDHDHQKTNPVFRFLDVSNNGGTYRARLDLFA